MPRSPNDELTTAPLDERGKRPKVWEEVTDEEIIEAVRFDQELDRDGISRSPELRLARPTPDQWEGEPPPNAALGVGLIPWFGPGSAPRGAVTRRLKKLAAEGRVERVAMVRPRGKTAPPAWRVA